MTLVDTHVHLFDPKRFPYHPAATYKPPPEPLEPYAKFALAAKLDSAIIVHPEPYQDDHKYLEYCFRHEPRPGFFKGTCLFDPISKDTPQRMQSLMTKSPGKIVALRIHAVQPLSKEPTVSGPIKDRDLRHPQMKQTWEAAHFLGLAIQMHFIPEQAGRIRELAQQFPQVTVVLDHLGRPGQGTSAQVEEVLRLAQLPRTILKFSGLTYVSKQPSPYQDAAPLIRKYYDAFGADRMIWGGLGMNLKQFAEQTKAFNVLLSFATEREKDLIRGLNAKRIFA